jgi:NifB/MoaA-like Fe-S oxidoreductase
LRLGARRGAPIGILTGEFGSRVISPLIQQLQRSDIRVIPVANEFFGGNTAVTGLMVGHDLQRVLAGEPAGHRYLLPDVCLSEGRFLDGTTIDELPRPVEVVATDGISLRKALEPSS